VISGSRRYRVDVNRSAVRALAALPRRVQENVARVLDTLAENPRPAGTVALKGFGGLYRPRIAGDYRVIYRVDDDARAVVVRVIGHRRDVYRSL
jgi:mRNA interferase RelE/StbE